MESKTEKIALFHYGLIAPLVLEQLPRGELTRRAQEIAARHYEIPGSRRTSVSVDYAVCLAGPVYLLIASLHRGRTPRSATPCS